MSRRHTLPEPRRLPRSGATRRYIRRQFVESNFLPALVLGWFKDDGTIEEADYVDPDKVTAVFSGRFIYQDGSNRAHRRKASSDTRWHSTGREKRRNLPKQGILDVIREDEKARHELEEHKAKRRTRKKAA